MACNFLEAIKPTCFNFSLTFTLFSLWNGLLVLSFPSEDRNVKNTLQNSAEHILHFFRLKGKETVDIQLVLCEDSQADSKLDIGPYASNQTMTLWLDFYTFYTQDPNPYSFQCRRSPVELNISCLNLISHSNLRLQLIKYKSGAHCGYSR